MLFANTSFIDSLANEKSSFSDFLKTEAKLKKRPPVSFTHQPFLLLKFTPTTYFEKNSMLTFGAEIAPPIGKFSINADYGFSRGAWNLQKSVRQNYADSELKQWKGEIRTYFSDWYPFYALDKKPFGRYYALEIGKLTVNRNEDLIAVKDGQIAIAKAHPIQTVRQTLHLKYGRHFIMSKHFFIDAYAGIGIGKQVNSTSKSLVFSPINNFSLPFQSDYPVEEKITLSENFNYAPLNGSFIDFDKNNFAFSKTMGIRLCFVL